MCRYANVQMKKILFPFSFIFLFVGCDPLYHVRYIVENDSGKTVYFVNTLEADTILKKNSLKFGDRDTVITDSGVGYAKPFFKEGKDAVRKGLVFFSDSSLCDSCMIVPKGIWNYTEKNRCEGNANMIITPDDLKK